MSKSVRYIVLVLVVLVILAGCGISNHTPQTSVDNDRQVSEFEVNGRTVSVDYTDVENKFREEFEKDCYLYRLLDSSELTVEMLESRNGSVIVERCIGIVTNKDTGDGKVLNYQDPDCYYISYRGMDDVRDGTIVVSYMVYNPDNNYFDDIMERYDFVVSRELED